MTTQQLLDYWGVPIGGNANKFFTNGEVFSNTYTPESLPGRAKQMMEIVAYIEGCYERNQHLFISGKTGTGKTAVAKHVIMHHIPNEYDVYDRGRDKVIFNMNGKNGIVLYANCRRNSTKLRLLKKLNNIVSESHVSHRSWSDARDWFGKYTSNFDFAVLILDEIDALEDSGILYDFSRWGDDYKTVLSVIAISNKLTSMDNLDTSTKSSYTATNLQFPAYQANDLIEILNDRAKLGLVENALDDAVIPDIASRAALDGGDARLAIHLLKMACEIAGLRNIDLVDIECANIAYKKVNANMIVAPIADISLHEKICLYAITNIVKKWGKANTGIIYKEYQRLSNKLGYDPLTPRRITQYIDVFNDLGIINAKQVSRGRHGRTKLVTIPDYIDLIREKIEEDKFLGLGDVK